MELADGIAVLAYLEESAIGTDPDVACSVFEEALDGRVDAEIGVDADVFGGEEGVLVPAVYREAAAQCAYPQPVLLVFDNTFYLVVADGPGVIGIVAVYGEGIAVVSVKAILGTEPHEAVAVAEDAVDAALGEAVAGGKGGETDGFLSFAGHSGLPHGWQRGEKRTDC